MTQHECTYIKFMIRTSRVLTIIILISLSITPLFALGWDIGLSGSGFVSFPGEIQENAVGSLNSASISLSYSPLVVKVSPQTLFSIPIQLTYTTRSQFNGPIYYKDFTTFMSGIDLEIEIKKPFSLSLALLYALQIKDDERGWFGFIITKGSFIISLTKEETPSTLYAFFPIEVELRSDYTGLRIGAGLRYRYMREKI